MGQSDTGAATSSSLATGIIDAIDAKRVCDAIGALVLPVAHFQIKRHHIGKVPLISPRANHVVKASQENLREALRGRVTKHPMLAYMNDAANPLNAYPALWAPFVVVGEGAGR